MSTFFSHVGYYVLGFLMGWGGGMCVATAVAMNDEMKSRRKNRKRLDIMHTAASATATHSGLGDIKYEDLIEYSLKGSYDYKAVRVFDGDTLHVAIHVDNNIFRICCRLLEIDAPEIPISHSDALSSTARDAFIARDRLVELVTDLNMSEEKSKQGEYRDTVGNLMPSFTDTQLQKLIDEKNKLVIKNGVVLCGIDNFGRYLVHMKTKDGRNVSRVMLDENIVVPFKSSAGCPDNTFDDPFVVV